jgi:ATP-dependent RNA helicase RhlE
MKYIPQKRQTLFFSATMPQPILELTKELLNNPSTINMERKSAPPVGITQAVYPIAQEAKSALLLELLKRGIMKEVLVFTRTKHRANRLWQLLDKNGIKAARIHGNRSQAQRTDALDGFKKGAYRVLVATDIAARGIDVDALGHVVNFDVPAQPEDYIHRVGRTARAELTGEAYTFVAPDEMGDLRAIEKAIGKTLLRVTLPDFNPAPASSEKLEIPIAERIAAIRARKAEERARAKAKEERRAAGGGSSGRPQSRPSSRPAPKKQDSGDSPYASGRPSSRPAPRGDSSSARPNRSNPRGGSPGRRSTPPGKR